VTAKIALGGGVLRVAGREHDEGLDDLAGDGGMIEQRALHFRGADEVSGGLDDVVVAPDEPEMAVRVALDEIAAQVPSPGEAATVHISADPDNDLAEYAIIIAREVTGMGFGVLLMRRIIDYARSRGIRRIFGDVLRENTIMLKLCHALGFMREGVPDEPEIVRVNLTL